jgi:predicted AAA+ superfamily ATPase
LALVGLARLLYLKKLLDSNPSKTLYLHGEDTDVQQVLAQRSIANYQRLRNDTGELWENYLITERLKKLRYQGKLTETYFWRTYDQQEIDWVEYVDGQIAAFEFKWGKANAKLPRAFLKAYPEANFSVVNPSNYLDFII